MKPVAIIIHSIPDGRDQKLVIISVLKRLAFDGNTTKAINQVKKSPAIIRCSNAEELAVNLEQYGARVSSLSEDETRVSEVILL